LPKYTISYYTLYLHEREELLWPQMQKLIYNLQLSVYTCPWGLFYIIIHTLLSYNINSSMHWTNAASYIIIYRLSHVYVYVHSTFGIITIYSSGKLTSPFGKFKSNLQFAIDWRNGINNKFVRRKWNHSSIDESLVLLWWLKILRIWYFG